MLSWLAGGPLESVSRIQGLGQVFERFGRTGMQKHWQGFGGQVFIGGPWNFAIYFKRLQDWIFLHNGWMLRL